MGRNIVFFIQNFSRPAGSERVCSLVANALAERGFSVTVLSVCGNNTCFYPLRNEVRLVTLLDRAEVSHKKNFFRIRSALKRFYKHNPTDLVIDIFASLSLYTLSLKRRFRYRSVTWEHFNFKADVGFNRFGRKLAARYADFIVTLTEKDKGYYCAAFPRRRAQIECLYNPSPYARERVAFSEREPIVLSVGRLTAQKGFGRMLEIWKETEPLADGWRLVIVGSGEEESRLREMIATYGLQRAELLPATKEIASWYRRAKLYLSTSWFEGLPMTMIEAQSFGLPILSYDYDTGPSDIIADGENGILVTDGDAERMKAALLSVMRDDGKAEKMSEAAFYASERFEAKKIYARWNELVEKLI